MRIVSLLPSATEIVFQLGLGGDLRGVSFECDHPVEARSIQVVSGTALTTTAPPPGVGGQLAVAAADIDAEVRSRMAADLPISTLDSAALRAIDPDLILAQDLCRVCAVPSGDVEEALDAIGCHAEVVSLDPGRLDDVIGAITAVGRATGTEGRAATLVEGLRARLDRVAQRTAGTARPRVLVVEWPDPLFNAGHWVPDMVAAAGGTAVLASAGERSRTITWADVEAEQVDVTVFAPCGFDLDGAVAQAGALLALPGADRHLGQVWAVDANAQFSRPGPRVVDGVEVLADILHGDPAGIAPDRARRLA